MQLKLLPLLEEYDVETLQFTDHTSFEKYYKLLKMFNFKWSLQYANSSLSCVEVSSLSSSVAVHASHSGPSVPANQPITVDVTSANQRTISEKADSQSNKDRASTNGNTNSISSQDGIQLSFSNSSSKIANPVEVEELLTTDSAQEEHDRSSPTDMSKALADHEKVFSSFI